MTNPKRFFMVKVTGCGDCPHCENFRCDHDAILAKQWNGSGRIYFENVQAITPSCPLYGQSQEEKK